MRVTLPSRQVQSKIQRTTAWSPLTSTRCTQVEVSDWTCNHLVLGGGMRGAPSTRHALVRLHRGLLGVELLASLRVG